MPPLLRHLRAAAGTLLLLLLAVSPVAAHDDPEDEVDDLSVALIASPRDVALLLRRANLLRDLGQWKAALEDLDRAGRLDPRDPDVDLARGRVLVESGEPARARVALDRVLARRPADGEALVLRSRALLGLGRVAEAVADYDRALVTLEVLTPDHVLERARLAPQDSDSALAILDRGIARIGPTVSLMDEAIRIDVARGRFAEALARLDRLAPQYGRRESVDVRRAELLARLGRTAEARQTARDALASIAALSPLQRNGPAVLALTARAESLLETPNPTPSERP